MGLGVLGTLRLSRGHWIEELWLGMSYRRVDRRRPRLRTLRISRKYIRPDDLGFLKLMTTVFSIGGFVDFGGYLTELVWIATEDPAWHAAPAIRHTVDQMG